MWGCRYAAAMSPAGTTVGHVRDNKNRAAGLSGASPSRSWAVVAGRLLLVVAVLAVVAVVVAALPMPHLEHFRQLAAHTGRWFPVLFGVLYALGSALPIPRSTFTYSAAVLFVPGVAIPLSVTASTAAAVLAFVVVRRLGYARTAWWRNHPRAAGVRAHLERRGWVAVVCLRMVPAVPFSLLSYAAALSPIRLVPFVLATVAGTTPGTVAAILFGNALTTGQFGWGLVATGVIAGLGIIGLIVDARIPSSDAAPTR